MAVRVEIHRRELEALAAGPEVTGELLTRGKRVAELARSRAEHAESHTPPIRAELTEGDDGEPEVRVGWPKEHFYLYFHEVGTEHEPARPFLRPALDAVMDEEI